MAADLELSHNMFILPISDDINQSFSFNADSYPTRIVLKCPDGKCSTLFETPPIVDVYITGYEPILGLPLINGVDILKEHVSSLCAPLDYGAIIPLSKDGSPVTCSSLALGDAALVYMNAAEIIFSSLTVVQ